MEGLPAQWPEWWEWELELIPHLLKRMVDRDFNEVDLRQMLDVATDYRTSSSEGRFLISCRYHGRRWEVVVEPDETTRSLIVVTAYAVDAL
jgi:hypothetical protein